MHAENLQSLLDNSGGVLFAKDIAAAGVPNIYLTEFLKKGKLFWPTLKKAILTVRYSKMRLKIPCAAEAANNYFSRVPRRLLRP